MPTANGSRNFDDSQFASQVLDFKLGSQSFLFSPGTVTHGPFQNVSQFGAGILGSGLTQGLTVAGNEADFVTLKFAHGGSALYIWEAGDLSDTGDTHLLASTDAGHSFSQVLHIGPFLKPTNPLDRSSSFNTNVAIVTAADFGLPNGALINALKITSQTNDHADILAVAAIPEPRIAAGILAGIVLVVSARRTSRCSNSS
jgi:hypothetical protein